MDRRIKIFLNLLLFLVLSYLLAAVFLFLFSLSLPTYPNLFDSLELTVVFSPIFLPASLIWALVTLVAKTRDSLSFTLSIFDFVILVISASTGLFIFSISSGAEWAGFFAVAFFGLSAVAVLSLSTTSLIVIYFYPPRESLSKLKRNFHKFKIPTFF